MTAAKAAHAKVSFACIFRGFSFLSRKTLYLFVLEARVEVAYRLARPALRGFSSRPRGPKQATDRQSGGVLNIEEKLIAVGTLPRLAPRRSSTPPPSHPPQKKKKSVLPAVFALMPKAGRNVKERRETERQ